ncbi:hypothetical protein I3U58_00005, partial [Mycobacteroides abscessus subsp. abscessus]
HRASDDTWVAERPPALITGPRTGYGNPGCYARSSQDCDELLTREHWISDDLLERVSNDKKVIAVEGAAWQGRTPKQKIIGINSMSSKILCSRHNRALSPLDKVAAEFFTHLRDDLLDMNWHTGLPPHFPNGFTLISGPYFELWLLKVLWGAIEAGALTVNGHVAYRFRLGVTTATLTEILWRGAQWPKDWGMYVMLDRDTDYWIKGNAVRVRPANVESEILGGYIQIGGFEYNISFESPPVRRIYRPAAISFQRRGFNNCWKMAAFAWPELGHEMVNAFSHRAPGEDPSVPPTPRAASLRDKIMPGSVNVTSGATPEQRTVDANQEEARFTGDQR